MNIQIENTTITANIEHIKNIYFIILSAIALNKCLLEFSFIIF